VQQLELLFYWLQLVPLWQQQEQQVLLLEEQQVVDFRRPRPFLQLEEI
jgi:hypothetical protein